MVKQFLDQADKDNAYQTAVARNPIELSHRISNIFAIVSGLVALSARGRPEARAFARDLQARFDALASAYRYASPQLASPAPLAGSETVKGLLRILTAPYRGEGDDAIVLEGQDAPIGLRAASTLALIVHELATNAVKHGALSSETGTVISSAPARTGGTRSNGARTAVPVSRTRRTTDSARPSPTGSAPPLKSIFAGHGGPKVSWRRSPCLLKRSASEARRAGPLTQRERPRRSQRFLNCNTRQSAERCVKAWDR
jgi:two-component sensor histidine kinase